MTIATSSKLLIDESPLQLLPTLACVIGDRAAIAFQQLHYWIGKSKNEWDGRRWVYNSYAEWQRDSFPFWTEDMVARVFQSLEERGLVLAINNPNNKYDRRKWYTIDYDALNSLEPTSRKMSVSRTAKCGDPSGQNAVMETGKMPGSKPAKSPDVLTETSTETSSQEITRETSEGISAESLWQKAVSELELSMTQPTFETWVKPSKALGFAGEVLVVETPNQYGVDWLGGKMHGQVSRALSRASGRVVPFEVRARSPSQKRTA